MVRLTESEQVKHIMMKLKTGLLPLFEAGLQAGDAFPKREILFFLEGFAYDIVFSHRDHRDISQMMTLPKELIPWKGGLGGKSKRAAFDPRRMVASG
ncbi:unnamed protein product [Blepharisma stoltei]|uniref:Uncharacterized protein n=1 Tax=Blepharisma stoltei TaxID=1481888 RepID=A0AAU9JX29_9CILI|nr:unnamed protein product [Blepharisma stoltei]